MLGPILFILVTIFRPSPNYRNKEWCVTLLREFSLYLNNMAYYHENILVHFVESKAYINNCMISGLRTYIWLLIYTAPGDRSAVWVVHVKQPLGPWMDAGPAIIVQWADGDTSAKPWPSLIGFAKYHSLLPARMRSKELQRKDKSQATEPKDDVLHEMK